MKGIAYQPTDSTSGGITVDQNVAWVKISFNLAYCEVGTARLIISLWPSNKEVLNEEIYPSMSTTFEAFFPEEYVEILTFKLDPNDWSVAINNVATEWADAAQAPKPPPEDIIVKIPLTLILPSVPPPPEEDWWTIISEWLTENWYAAVAVIIIFLIGVFVWARYK